MVMNFRHQLNTKSDWQLWISLKELMLTARENRRFLHIVKIYVLGYFKILARSL